MKLAEPFGGVALRCSAWRELRHCVAVLSLTVIANGVACAADLSPETLADSSLEHLGDIAITSVSGRAERNLTWVDVFIQDVIAPKDDLNLTAGVRGEHNSYTGFEVLPSVHLYNHLRSVELISADPTGIGAAGNDPDHASASVIPCSIFLDLLRRV
jgi:hypothetical protein